MVEGVLPGRPWVWNHFGLNGEDGVVPDVAAGPVERGTFVSERRLGTSVDWTLTRPPAAAGVLPVVVALHGGGGDAARLVGPDYGLPQFLAAAVADGAPPYAIATVDGGTSYWHAQPDGEDAGAMVVDELLPLLAERGVATGPTDRIGLLGWSMGGYGVLHLGGLLGAERVSAVCAVSPALWTDPDDASRSGFADAAEYDDFRVTGRQADLSGIAVRIDCGTGDPFYFGVRDYVEGFPAEVDLATTWEPGGHDTGYRRRMLPAELAFLGEHVSLPS